MLFARQASRALSLLLAAAAFARAAVSESDLLPYFLPPEISRPKLSPTGEFVAVVVRKDDVYALGVYDLKSGRQRLIGGARDAQVIDVWWKAPRRLLALTRDAKNESASFQAVDVDGSHAEKLRDIEGWLADPMPEDPDNVIVLHRGVTRINLKTGSETNLETGIDAGRWFPDAQGNVRAAMRTDLSGFFVWWRPPGERAWKETRFEDRVPDFLPLGVDRDPRFLLVADYRQGDNLAISRLDTATGARTPVARREGVDPTHTVSVGERGRIVAVRYEQLRGAPLDVLDPVAGAALVKLQEAFPGLVADPSGLAPDEKTWLVTLRSSRVPGTIVLVDAASGRVQPLGKMLGERLPEKNLAPAELLSTQAGEGRRLTAMLWRPANIARAPLVVLAPEFLPKVPAEDRFQPEVQALVRAGFAVLDVNVRGTFGFGQRHLEAAEADLGGALREDYQTVIAALAKAGIVDDKRVAILGEGMGGAMAVFLATSSQVFAAAININGPVQLGQDAMLSFVLGRDRTQIGRQFGWKRLRQFADDLALGTTAARCSVPALHLYNDAIENKGRLNDSGQKVRKLVAGAPAAARVEVAYSRVIGLKPPTQLAREQSAIFAKIAAFLAEAMPPVRSAAAP
jgi:dipeptidyl aminopeptidase/acylaminoacyl peptidase